MIYKMEDAIKELRKFQIGDVVLLNNQHDTAINDDYDIEEYKKTKVNTPYLVTDIQCDFDIAKINNYLLSPYTHENLEIEGEMLYQLFSITENQYCDVMVNSEEIDKIGTVIK